MNENDMSELSYFDESLDNDEDRFFYEKMRRLDEKSEKILFDNLWNLYEDS